MGGGGIDWCRDVRQLFVCLTKYTWPDDFCIKVANFNLTVSVKFIAYIIFFQRALICMFEGTKYMNSLSRTSYDVHMMVHQFIRASKTTTVSDCLHVCTTQWFYRAFERLKTL